MMGHAVDVFDNGIDRRNGGSGRCEGCQQNTQAADKVSNHDDEKESTTA
jgi:hypothetical protein